MKKTTSLILAIIICFLSFSLSVFGHSGRTDSNGGHWNHSTGEYHWHHGYSAHQHQDRDGDGYKEWCPYKNSNSTSNNNAGSNSNNSGNSGNFGNSNASSSTSTTNKTNNSKYSAGDIFGIIIGVVVLVLMVGYYAFGIGRIIFEAIKEKIKKRRK